MKLGLYSITFLGVWYRGPALTLEDLITRAREYGYDGIEIDGKRPHGNPIELTPHDLDPSSFIAGSCSPTTVIAPA